VRPAQDRPLLLLAGIAWLAGLSGAFVNTAPNRLAEGTALSLAQAVPEGWAAAIATLGALLLAGAWLPRRPSIDIAILALAGSLLLAILGAAGDVAALRTTAVVSPGGAFWIIGLVSLGIIADRFSRLTYAARDPSRLRRHPRLDRGSMVRPERTSPASRGAERWIPDQVGDDERGGHRRDRAVLVGVGLSIGVAVVFVFASGSLDHLSLLRDYATQRGNFRRDLTQHLLLVLTALAGALALGLPLGVLLAFTTRWQRPVFAVLNLIQTIPSIALFGLLMAPLAAIGLPGIGFLPAVIALTLYALLPIVRNTHAGLAGVDPAIIETARGIGFAPAQLFWRLQLPLALPLVLAGIRIALVQLIGLAVVAALIGAGGLGSFVFQGLGQDSIDRVLLGALPAIVLALAAYAALSGLGRLAERHRA
jgi:osmoprotectant transport system permease protein